MLTVVAPLLHFLASTESHYMHMITILGSIIDIYFYETFSKQFLNQNTCTSLLTRHSAYPLLHLRLNQLGLSFNGRVSTVNRALDGSAYLG